MQSEGKNRKETSQLLLSFGNPLLDMTVVVKDTSIHEKFGLPTDGQLEVNEQQMEIFDIAMKRNDIELTAGGCSLNTSRVFSWILQESNKVIFVGGIGKDEIAQKLLAIVRDSGVITRLVEVDHLPTGSCVALVFGPQRCLCANIGAAAVCRPEHVFDPKASNILAPPLHSIPAVYLEGYFITHSFDTSIKIAQYCRKYKKLFAFNLCGSYVCENNANEVEQLLPYVDVLFGYIEEYRSLQKFVSLPKLCKSLAKEENNIVHEIQKVFQYFNDRTSPKIFKKKSIESLKKKNNSSGPTSSGGGGNKTALNGNSKVSSITTLSVVGKKISNADVKIKELDDGIKTAWQELKKGKFVIVTQGPSPIICAAKNEIFEHPVAPIKPEKIIDTTGAGDSFVGGFLAAAAVGERLEKCLDCGVWAAQQLLQEKGCTIPKTPANFLSKKIGNLSVNDDKHSSFGT